MAKGYYGNAEAVVFNQAPFFNYFQQQQQRKKLEQQAIDKQINDDLAKLTPEGMRPQDVDSFLKGYQELKDLSIRYRDAIRNPAKNPAQWREYQERKANLTGDVAESKGAKEAEKSFYDFYLKYRDDIDLDSYRATMKDYKAPIRTPEHERVKNFDLTQTLFKPEKFDQIKWQALMDTVKADDIKITNELPTGQQNVRTLRKVNPTALASLVSGAFESDTLNAKKFYTHQFQNASPDDLEALEEYSRKHLDPNFAITSPKDYAIAANLYGKAERDLGSTVTGAPWKSMQAAADARQRRGFQHAEQMAAQRAAQKNKDDYIWEADMESALKNADTANVRRLATRLDVATPGVERVYLKEGLTKGWAMRRMKRALAENGVDGKTKYISKADLKAGVLVVLVPKVDKKTGGRIKDKYGKDEYDVMAVSAQDENIKNRLNALKTYAQGGTLKGLDEKIYEQNEAENAPPVEVEDMSTDFYNYGNNFNAR